jgi:hypothetical protein
VVVVGVSQRTVIREISEAKLVNAFAEFLGGLKQFDVQEILGLPDSFIRVKKVRREAAIDIETRESRDGVRRDGDGGVALRKSQSVLVLLWLWLLLLLL